MSSSPGQHRSELLGRLFENSALSAGLIISAIGVIRVSHNKNNSCEFVLFVFKD